MEGPRQSRALSLPMHRRGSLAIVVDDFVLKVYLPWVVLVVFEVLVPRPRLLSLMVM